MITATVLMIVTVIRRARMVSARKAGMAGMTQPVPPACPGRKASSCTCAGTCNGGQSIRHCLCPACLAFTFTGPGSGISIPQGILGTGGAGSTSAPGGGGGGAYASGNWVSGLAQASGTFTGTFSTTALRSALGLPPQGKARKDRAAHAGIEGFDGSSDFDFAVGSVRGLRQWKLPFDAELDNIMATDARPDPAALWPPGTPPPLLVGVAGGAWQPGVNHAKCKNFPEHVPPVEYDEARKSECGCGFWAYWGLTDKDWHDALPVFGIVEGTGRTLIGSKGFRCEKAQILALVPAFVIEVGIAPVVSPPFPSWRDVSAPQEVQGLSLQEAADRDQEIMHARQRADAWLAVCMDLLGQMYPGAQVFATLKAMIAKFPPGEVTQ